ncbi:hypothetical protein GL4_3196 [Methyloceanibacter caenitepidi]|uniref:Uncharacterized protein n=1 Tax=Methyloceanibacter caenitepidi TaxID=1384459 RepID=A0A0A8K7W0_9HYPH|nr:hypothetical protein GL4_3196 [Methyloceanibacter caenitepidi]
MCRGPQADHLGPKAYRTVILIGRKVVEGREYRHSAQFRGAATAGVRFFISSLPITIANSAAAPCLYLSQGPHGN